MTENKNNDYKWEPSDENPVFNEMLGGKPNPWNPMIVQHDADSCTICQEINSPLIPPLSAELSGEELEAWERLYKAVQKYQRRAKLLSLVRMIAMWLVLLTIFTFLIDTFIPSHGAQILVAAIAGFGIGGIIYLVETKLFK